jgi:hypothetical protein
MEYREDYYNFSHYILPYNVFNFKGMILKSIIKDTSCEDLKRSWDCVTVDNGIKSESPSFEMCLEKIDDDRSLIIIKIPEAKEVRETPFIGIIFDENFNELRYFVLEITEKLYGYSGFFLCEWSKEWNHINHKFYKELLSKDEFYKAVVKAI